MSKASRHIFKIMTVLLERSREALKAFETQHDELALEMLKSREIGFANLRTAEWHAKKDGWTLELDAEAQKLAQAVIDLDVQLMSAMKAAQDRAALDLRRMKRIRERMSKYHSGAQEGSRFEKPV
jgi:hypothetical protein